MPHFGERSQRELDTCHDNLKILFTEVIKHFDCTILQGHRGQEEQDEYFRTGKSKVQFPNSKHNQSPSLAVDVAPWPIDWNDRERFYHFAGYVRGIAAKMGISVRWGGDWDSDTELHDQTFMDLPHFELRL